MIACKTLLITGGTGSFGKTMLLKLLRDSKIPRIIIYSRDEQKQYFLKESLPKKFQKRVRFFIGDVRDEKRLNQAMCGVDVVVHAAAMKIVVTAEYDPFECVKTNVLGAQNIVSTSINNKVKNVIVLSTDKASNPINLYGATKLVADKIFVASNHLAGKLKTRFSVVRYGNVLGSRGSVLNVFLDQSKNNKKEFTITDKRMTRFFITVNQGVDFVIKCLKIMKGGEIFIPKIPSMKIIDLSKAINPKFSLKVIGIKPGEKIHEVLITKNDSRNTIEFNDFFIIKPEIIFSDYRDEKYPDKFKSVKDGFEYSSDTNSVWLNENEIKKLVENFVNLKTTNEI